MPTANSFELAEEIKNAELHIYPYAGYAFLFQHGALVAELIRLFLDTE